MKFEEVLRAVLHKTILKVNVSEKGVNIYLVNGTLDYCRGKWIKNARGTLLPGNLKDVYEVNRSLNIVLLSHNTEESVSWRIKDVYEVNRSLNIVLLSHNRQESVSWRIKEEGLCFIATSVKKK
jgi:hypothetical protein